MEYSPLGAYMSFRSWISLHDEHGKFSAKVNDFITIYAWSIARSQSLVEIVKNNKNDYLSRKLN